MTAAIDITFDFRLDTPNGKDPDSFSATLRRYHKLLWSKPLDLTPEVEPRILTNRWGEKLR
jgi:hypothetical protein